MNLIFVIIGYIGSATLSLSFIPQVIKAYSTKDVSSISKKFLILQLLTTLLWTTYSIGFILDKNYSGLPILIANGFILVCLLLLTLAVYKFKKTDNISNTNNNINTNNNNDNIINTNYKINNVVLV